MQDLNFYAIKYSRSLFLARKIYIKEYQKDGLHSLNPRYDVIRFESTDNQSVYLIGRVLGILDKSQIAKGTDVDRYKMIKGV